MISTSTSREPETAETGGDFPSSTEIKEALRRILESHPFRTTKQCQDLLKYVVLHSLSDDDGALRERIIGADVFGRKATYDTNEDPVVRVRAADVRKRIAQYYQSAEGETSLVRIEMPPGSYRAHFRYDRPVHAEQTPAHPEQPPTPETSEIAAPRKAFWSSSRLALIAAGMLLSVAVIVVALFAIRNSKSPNPPGPLESFWAPITDAQQPALIYLGTNAVYVLSNSYLARYRAEHRLPNDGPEFYVQFSQGSSIAASDLVPTPDTFASVADATAAVQVTSMLKGWNRPFVLRAGRDLSFGDLRERPSVMIGGFNNPWTLELTDGLPYRFSAGVSIVSRDHPNQIWTVPKDARRSTTDDYALITRLLSSKTGGPVITVAGIGQNGTQAAAEFLTNPEKMGNLLRTAPRGWQSKNMQAVLHVKVVGYLPVEVDVVATSYW